MLALLGITQMVAQEYEYVPFVREGVKWVYTYENYDNSDLGWTADPNLAYGTVYLTLELKGDTVINGKTYKAMHKYYGGAINTVNDTIPVYLREENKVVYGIVPDGKTYPDCPIGNIYDYTLLNNMRNGDEFILYNFQDPQAYWRNLFSPDMSEADFEEIFYDFVLQSTSFMNIGSHVVKCHTFGTYSTGFRMIEGIGVDGKSSASVWFGYTLYPWTPIYVGVGYTHFKIRYVTEGDEIIYKSVNFEGEKPTVDDNEYIPYITPGVKFINEKVIVNNGDTTSYYYTYEMTPDVICEGNVINTYYHDVLWCHYFTGPDIDELNDSIICGIYLFNQSDFDVFQNKAFRKIENEGRNLVIMWGTMESDRDYVWDRLYRYYNFSDFTALWYNRQEQINSYINPDNFYEVEPTMVDGRQMQRFAYFNEQGDTLAYIVQGIGFDSYDMGDLLTPFTRKPDPDADYQEWCGLSHVVKDGKIIYKGMRYRHGAFTGINEVMVDKARPIDDNYYNLMGQPVGKDVPTTPGIYIHQGKKICVSRTP